METKFGRPSLWPALLFFCSTSGPTALAQPGWLPRVVNMGPNLTGANRAAAIATLDRFEQLLKQVPELAHPNGFEIRATLTGGRGRLGVGDSKHADYAVAYQYVVNFFYPKLQPGVPATGAIIFAVNADENMRGGLDERGIFVEPPRWPNIPFSVVTYGVSGSGILQPNEDFTVTAWFAPGGQSPWHSVSREDYYTALIADIEGHNGETRAAARKALEKTGYERWLEEAPRRKKEREELLKTMAQLQSAAEVAQLRKTLEDGEREAGEQFKKSEGEDRERARTMFKSTDDMRAELSRMTPAERKLPAIVETDPAWTQWLATGSGMRDRDTVKNTVMRVLAPNYELWRARRSLAEVRVLAVHFEGAPDAPVLEAIYQTVKKLDWRAVAALVDQPAK